MNFIKSLFSPIKQIEIESLQFKFGFWKALGAILVYFIFTSFISGIFMTIFPETFLNNNYIVMIVAELITIPILSIVLINTFSKQTWMKNTYKKVNKHLLGYLALLIIAFRLIYDVTIYPVMNLIPEGELLQSLEPLINNNMLYFILSAVVIAPIIEEVVLRGVVLNGMLNKYSPKMAIIVSSLMFAVMHGNIHQGVNAFILGCLFGYIFYKTRSLYLVMFCHFVNNSFAMFGFFPESTIGFIINLVVSLALGIGILLFLKKNLKFSYEKHFISTLKNPETDKIYSSID